MKTEDYFNSSILSIDDVFPLMNNPRDLSKEEFVRFAAMCSIKPWKNTISSTNVAEIVQETGIAPSKSGVRQMIKAQSLRIGNIKINDVDTNINNEYFFETGFEDWKWTSVRNGKKIHRVILLDPDIND